MTTTTAAASITGLCRGVSVPTAATALPPSPAASAGLRRRRFGRGPRSWGRMARHSSATRCGEAERSPRMSTAQQAPARRSAPFVGASAATAAAPVVGAVAGPGRWTPAVGAAANPPPQRVDGVDDERAPKAPKSVRAASAGGDDEEVPEAPRRVLACSTALPVCSAGGSCALVQAWWCICSSAATPRCDACAVDAAALASATSSSSSSSASVGRNSGAGVGARRLALA
mmetsp:Transcript_30557/g.101647  ORF Transcript_30557/g.101647 Transcript_30557/m.101647 type:complete len:229 (-) Transcript_30557:186-872(-)|eukprot:CAMPEP_0203917118 /NCGR_PEP_ID=MMETSP0359-20131031/57755_1 /ASSEMBLY_ACC=CAM_ASM_000338 /TAXON_ID=268821 /ORGANISM="Scrippsiella Hangoei, Strain SHTV-5" /LENGTH=228 /DNA_ID=CAMNT_0050843945 /DNA_START=79 /DNA_END=765 /DNA_ORIENTATION=+